jgi:hypothetical protein
MLMQCSARQVCIFEQSDSPDGLGRMSVVAKPVQRSCTSKYDENTHYRVLGSGVCAVRHAATSSRNLKQHPLVSSWQCRARRRDGEWAGAAREGGGARSSAAPAVRPHTHPASATHTRSAPRAARCAGRLICRRRMCVRRSAATPFWARVAVVMGCKVT